MSTVTGIDFQDGSLYTAAVDYAPGRPEIVALDSRDAAPASDPWLLSGRVVVSVPDRGVIVKRLRPLGGGASETEDRQAFEMAQSLLEDESAFIFRFHATEVNGRTLGMAIRKELLGGLPGVFGSSEGIEIDYRLRSLALGKGYLAFCERVDGDLICVADIARTAVSLCLIYRQNIVDVASLAHAYDNLSISDQQERLAIDLKTVVNYRLSSLVEAGLSQPISAMILSGEGISDSCRQTVQRYFPVGVRVPEVNPGFLSESLAKSPDAQSTGRYLVALGLAAN
jgi:hypothetical protein